MDEGGNTRTQLPTERRQSSHDLFPWVNISLLTRVLGVSCDVRTTLCSVPSACLRLGCGDGQKQGSKEVSRIDKISHSTAVSHILFLSSHVYFLATKGILPGFYTVVVTQTGPLPEAPTPTTFHGPN